MNFLDKLFYPLTMSISCNQLELHPYLWFKQEPRSNVFSLDQCVCRWLRPVSPQEWEPTFLLRWNHPTRSGRHGWCSSSSSRTQGSFFIITRVISVAEQVCDAMGDIFSLLLSFGQPAIRCTTGRWQFLSLSRSFFRVIWDDALPFRSRSIGIILFRG